MSEHISGLSADISMAPRNTGTDEWQREANQWRVVLKYKGRQYTLNYWTGQLAGEPDAESVLGTVCSDLYSGESTFEDFCAELGYDEDSRSAFATWEAVVRQSKRVRRLLGDDVEEVAEKLNRLGY